MSSIQSKRRSLVDFQRRLFASRFFTVSVLLHFIFILAFGGTKLVQQYTEPADFSGDPGQGFVSNEAPMEMPPVQQPVDSTPAIEVSTPTATSSIEAITTNSTISEPSFVLPSIAAPVINPSMEINNQIATPTAPSLSSGPNLSTAQLQGIRDFTQSWAKGKSGSGVGSNPQTREFEFTAYLAKYGDPRDPKRMGDWASTNEIKDGKIVRGSLPNLLYLMNTMSKDKIQALPNAMPLDLSSQEIFAKKPPFILMTGHRDFVLSETEVENLRKYITLGGCIWGDSSLPGRRSRFDIAFRREMRRIIPDADKDWEQLPPNHPLFTKNLYYKDITAPPPGMNYYQEPVYALKFGGEVAIIYTANDYNDMWRIALTAERKYDLSRDEEDRYIVTNRQVWDWKEVYYHNLSPEALYTSYKFGTNLVIHLLTRWEDHTRNLPAGLQ
ncbi:MAG TPA: DUF4159 domain-containing protein [Chthoniobacteraceae bacterium]|nr:DUF4159 domain-containing protein [Chthoniobacteraceae bacterium]